IHKQPQGKDMATGRPGTYGNTQNNHKGKIWLQADQEHTGIHKTTTRERYGYRQTRNIREYTKQPQGKDMATGRPGTYGNTQNNHKGKIWLQADQEHTGIHKQPQGKDMATGRPGTYGNTQTTTRERYGYRQTRNIREYTKQP
ncbi:hypothetical protein LSAT2_009989, partial [Lamellibrachia satsuma]